MKKIKYLMVPLFVFLFILTGCGEKKEENVNNTQKEQVKEEIRVEEKDGMLYVNGNKVDFYSAFENKNFYVKEEDFYICNNVANGYLAADGNIYNGDLYDMQYVILDDLVYVTISPCYYMTYTNYFIDREGKIVKSLGGSKVSADINLSGDILYSNKIKATKVEGNSIYFTTYDPVELYLEYYCSNISGTSKENEIYEYVDKITYVNGEFNLEKAIETKTYKEYAASGYNCTTNNVYYNMGDEATPNKKQYTNYLDMFKEPYYGGYMIIKNEVSLDDTIKSVCIYENNNLECFSNDDDGKNNLSKYFGSSNCTTKNGVECKNEKFTCNYLNNKISCSSSMNGPCVATVDASNFAISSCY